MSSMMIMLFPLLFILIFRINLIYSNCPLIDICRCEGNQVICDGYLGNHNDTASFPSLANLPPVQTYYFSNFQKIQANAFAHARFLPNNSTTIYISNITLIESNAFSASMIIPENSTVTIYIGDINNALNLILEDHAFTNTKIDRLHFMNIKNFNGKSIFETHCFSSSVDINELIFEQCDITAFDNSGSEPADIQNISIRACPLLTDLNGDILPTFITTAEAFEISGTGLKSIDSHTFEAWSLILRELRIKNNVNFKNFSKDIVDGVLMQLTTLDLSNNSISALDQDYDWFPYSYAKNLLLKNQQYLDLFFKSNIFKTLGLLTTIDLSESYIDDEDNNDDLIQKYFPDIPNLLSMNISYTNFNEKLIIDLLTSISTTADEYIQISLLGHTLNDSNFCSYFQIFQNAPNLLRLELDETHECNCIVDLFFSDETMDMTLSDSLLQPSCINLTRPHCNIQDMVKISKCAVRNANADANTPGDIGSYAFIGIMVGLTIVLLALLALGSNVIYRARKGRRGTILDMEYPVDRSLSLSIAIDEPYDNSVSNNNNTIEQPSDS